MVVHPPTIAIEKTYALKDAMLRQVFIRKVYTILVMQLLLTLVASAFFVYSEDAQSFLKEHMNLIVLINFATIIATWCMIVYCENPNRTFPLNCVLLVIFTFALILGISLVVAYNNEEAYHLLFRSPKYTFSESKLKM